MSSRTCFGISVLGLNHLGFKAPLCGRGSLFYYFPEKYKVDIIPSYDMDSLLPETSVKAMMDIISQKASFGDALIANHVNHFFKEKTVFVSWDAIHFKHLLSVKALTPREFLQSKEPLLK